MGVVTRPDRSRLTSLKREVGFDESGYLSLGMVDLKTFPNVVEEIKQNRHRQPMCVVIVDRTHLEDGNTAQDSESLVNTVTLLKLYERYLFLETIARLWHTGTVRDTW